jgi:hypothetical protein
MKDNSSLLLSIFSSVGVFATGVLSADAAVKTHDLVISKRDDDRIDIYNRYASQGKANEYDVGQIYAITPTENYKITPKEAIDIWWKPVTVGGLTIASIIFNHQLNMRQQASIVALAGASGAMFGEYRNKVIDIYGKEADDKIIDEIIKCGDGYPVRTIYGDWVNEIGEEDLNEPVTFYDEYVGYFEATPHQMYKAMYHLNREILCEGYATLSTFYDLLSIPHEKMKDPLTYESYGWSYDEIILAWEQAWLDISFKPTHVDNGSMVVYRILYNTEPFDLNDAGYELD